MRRGPDWVVWCVSFGLFMAGGIFFKITPGKISMTDFVGIVSAIGTFAAAVAAWQSAKISKDAAIQSRSATRFNELTSHKKHFDELLQQVERDLGVVFYNGAKLYDDIFPNNRDLTKSFSIIGTGECLRSWESTYVALGNFSHGGYKKSIGIHRWVITAMQLSGSMQMRNLQSDCQQIYLDGFTPTGFDEEHPAKYMIKVCDVLNRIYQFSFVDISVSVFPASGVFEEAFKEYFLSIVSGDANHQFRGPR